MKLNLMDEITLDTDDKYTVANTAIVDGIEYYLLVNDYDDIIIGYIEGNELVSIQDNTKFGNLLTQFDPKKVLGNLSDEEINEILNDEEN